jgi:hypothetical protein
MRRTRRVRSSVREGLRRFDTAGGLVNNAGIGVLGVVEKPTAEAVDHVRHSIDLYYENHRASTHEALALTASDGRPYEP